MYRADHPFDACLTPRGAKLTMRPVPYRSGPFHAPPLPVPCGGAAGKAAHFPVPAPAGIAPFLRPKKIFRKIFPKTIDNSEIPAIIKVQKENNFHETLFNNKAGRSDEQVIAHGQTKGRTGMFVTQQKTGDGMSPKNSIEGGATILCSDSFPKD